MPEKHEAPRQGDLLEALDSLTGLIAQQERRERFPVEDEAELDLDGFEFGSALDDVVPLLSEAAQSPAPVLPSPQEIEILVDGYLDRRLADLREQLKRELLIELHQRFPNP
jgi:hypothetical protein